MCVIEWRLEEGPMSVVPAEKAAKGAVHVARRQNKKIDRRLAKFLALEDFEMVARRRLPRMLYGFVAGGAETNAALRSNFESFADYSLVPRVLTDVSALTLGRTLFGHAYSAPFGIAPMGAASICAYRSDIVTARSAAARGIPAIVSASSLIPMEEIRQAGPTTWYQAYLPGDADRIDALVARVAAAGFDTFVLTADVPVPANRENNIRNGFSVPIKPNFRLLWEGLTHPRWLLGTWARTILMHGLPHFENMDAQRGPPIISRQLERAVGNRDQLSWEHVKRIRKAWKGTLVIKGILSAADALIAKDCGADGIIVSNHGGRQLDSAVAPLRVLPQITNAVSGLTIMLDGGIRRGTDVLKALALGADFVFVGRPFLFAAVCGGERGVGHAVDILSSEISRDMALMGLRQLSDISREFVARVR
jgi:L-lactate dehydrogenase (cytochrome)